MRVCFGGCTGRRSCPDVRQSLPRSKTGIYFETILEIFLEIF
jgi:hypothetical protein